MLHVVLDTNAVGIDRPLASNAHVHLLDAGAEGSIQLVVPTLVIDETLNKWQESLEPRLREFKRAEERLIGAGLLPREHRVELPDIAAAMEVMRDELEAKLTDARALCPGLPKIGHEAIVARALARKQPFDDKGKDGYRDVLLWELVLVLVEREPEVVLISADKRAFHSEEGRELSTALRVEAAARSGRPDAVRLFADVASAVRELIAPSEELRVRVDALLRREQDCVDDLLENLADSIGHTELTLEERAAVGLLPRSLSATILDADELTGLTVRYARAARNEEILIEGSADLSADVSIDFPVDDYAMLASTEGIGMTSVEADEGVATVQLRRALTVEFEARLVLDEPHLLDADVVRVVAADPPFPFE
jgi:hypothetical protein